MYTRTKNRLTIVHEQEEPQLATVFVARLADGVCIEFVESVQPPIPASEKWVNIVSVLRGCPIRCPFCDAGGTFKGTISEEELFAQIDVLVHRRFADGRVPVPKWKIQFARMGDPAFNPAVLRVIEQVEKRYHAPGFHPSISTVAPESCDGFFEDMLAVKHAMDRPHRFQLQFSLHTTCESTRRELIPVRTWSFDHIAGYGEQWFRPGDRKITLNFALASHVPFEPQNLPFSPEKFLLKITPVNPTRNSLKHGIESAVDVRENGDNDRILEQCAKAGYETILSIGELKENEIGSNCGMYLDAMETRNRQTGCAGQFR